MKILYFFSIIITLIVSGCNFGKSEIIVVPKGFRGYVLIIFNQQKGLPPKFSNNKRVYQVPKNGILKTQFSANYGWTGVADFYYKNITVKNKIPTFVEFEKIPRNTTVGFIGSSGNSNKDLAGKERIAYSFLYVGTKSEIKQYKELTENLDVSKLTE